MQHQSPGADPLDQLRPLLAVTIASAFATSLLFVRAIVARRFAFGFLEWNLFLAWVPLICAMTAEGFRLAGRTQLRHLLPPLGMWLLFLPNAPYILTDLVHARPPFDASYWCDLGLILSFAFAGMLAGITSMRLVRTTLTAVAGPVVAHGMILLSAALCGVGIYLGRVLRWNSWDLLTHPHELLPPIGRAMLNPWAYRHAVAMSLMFGVLFMVIYLAAELANGRPTRDMIRE